MSENKLYHIVQIMQDIDDIFINEKIDRKTRAYEDLITLIKPVEILDDDEELDGYRKEKYGV